MKYTFENNLLTIYASNRFADMTIGMFFDVYFQSAANRKRLLRTNAIRLDGIPVKSEDEKIGLRDIQIFMKENGIDHVMAKEPCEVVYEDCFLYIAHKDAGYIIHGEEDDTDCLLARAARYQNDHGIFFPVRPIHRLDKDTSGLVLFSRLPFFQPWFDQQLSDKKIERSYLAVCKGNMPVGKTMTIRSSIGRDRHRSGAYRVSTTGKSAVTHIECIDEKNGYVLIACRLETGRTHQIRVHLQSIGLPIVNDPLYGVSSSDFEKMGLWAYSITFRNPVTGKKHRIHDLENPDYTFFGGIKL